MELCLRCKVNMTLVKDEHQIPFHGEHIISYYTCPICNIIMESCETTKKNIKTTTAAQSKKSEEQAETPPEQSC